ncbi:OLC1v1012251C1 [Oldenlandia corymbosa var. corymbosa]|uniref:OLC1v1012251C1 n=1 Tax=Oldenlandia corymbosa var. corymbosa TaxID=529605 RepID=A0AAV1DVH7_OLDCO|nr:OLC1v1012251C1 [Oldenlandia corymbosa var. corymbosa]
MLEMSTASSSGSENSYDAEELFQIRNRWKELRKEKELWKDSQSQSFELIKRLELHSKTLSEAQSEDKKRIEQLERELSNCSQEIEYLQDQLNARNSEINSLDEHVCVLQLKIARMENLEEEVTRLNEELNISNSGRFFLLEELENKETELQKAVSCINKLEESLSSAELEYQCEIESMKFDMLALQQNLVDARKSHKETALENAQMIDLVQDLETRIQEDKKIIMCLENENKDLCQKLQKSELDIKRFCQKVVAQFQGWLVDEEVFFSDVEEDTRTSAEALGRLVSKLEVLRTSNAEWRDRDATLSQIHEYELLVCQLKEELKEEKFKAKEEAEDLAQEMAELRYQITGMLEDERKRRARVEQISLQRIAELEAELEKERHKSLNDEDHKKSISIVKHTGVA